MHIYITKMMKGIFRTRMPRDPRRSYPCPIFSKRLYFFLGSPTLTMLPEGERKRAKRERESGRIQIE
jgi:hypothetical protein